jgi:hypothetical protein
MEVSDQTEQLAALNRLYKEALEHKVAVYNNLIDNLKMLSEKQSQFVAQEIEKTKMQNQLKLLKLELNQRELFLSESGEMPIHIPLSDQKALRELDKKKE